MKTPRIYLILLLAIPFIFAACRKEKGCNDPEAINYNPDAEKDDGSCEYPEPDKFANIYFVFDHEVDEELVEMNNLKYLNAAENIYSIMTLKYLVSDFYFKDKNDNSIHIDTFHYRDIKFDDTRILKTSIPAGDYEEITFVFGMNSERNYTGSLPNETVYNAFEWPEHMGGGYHYMMLEGRYRVHTDSINEYNYNTHTGRLEMNNMVNENFVTITIPHSTTAIKEGETWEFVLRMNVNEWYNNPNLYDFSDFPPGIMNNQNAQTLLKENGHNIFYIKEMKKK